VNNKIIVSGGEQCFNPQKLIYKIENQSGASATGEVIHIGLCDACNTQTTCNNGANDFPTCTQCPSDQIFFNNQCVNQQCPSDQTLFNNQCVNQQKIICNQAIMKDNNNQTLTR